MKRIGTLIDTFTINTDVLTREFRKAAKAMRRFAALLPPPKKPKTVAEVCAEFRLEVKGN